MRSITNTASLILTTVGLTLSSAASAGFVSVEAPVESINSCVSEIGQHADYSEAGHIRHVLKETGRRSLAYKLKFATKVYGDSDEEVIREYRTECVVYAGQKPVYFEISEKA